LWKCRNNCWWGVGCGRQGWWIFLLFFVCFFFFKYISDV
jgi:hypothetical protein